MGEGEGSGSVVVVRVRVSVSITLRGRILLQRVLGLGSSVRVWATCMFFVPYVGYGDYEGD